VRGFEPLRLAARVSKTRVYANSTTPAWYTMGESNSRYEHEKLAS
jgi:hypothetical protein